MRKLGFALSLVAIVLAVEYAYGDVVVQGTETEGCVYVKVADHYECKSAPEPAVSVSPIVPTFFPSPTPTVVAGTVVLGKFTPSPAPLFLWNKANSLVQDSCNAVRKIYCRGN